MQLTWIQHVPFEGLGGIATWAAARGHDTRRIRPASGESVPAPADIEALIVLGGPMGVDDASRLPWLAAEISAITACCARGVPVLGICLGAQILAEIAGGQVRAGREAEIGWAPITRRASDPALAALADTEVVCHWHGQVIRPPRSATVCFTSPRAPQIIRFGAHQLGLQCHLECSAEGLAALLQHCPTDPMRSGRATQDAAAIRNGAWRCAGLHRTMAHLLDAWIDNAPPAA